MKYRNPNAPLMFFRTAGDAFRDADYSSPIERPYPSFWRRIFNLLRGW